MVRASKAEIKPTEQTTEPVSVKTEKPRTKKEKVAQPEVQPVPPEPVVDVPPVQTTQVLEEEQVAEVQDINTKIVEFNTKLQQLSTSLVGIKSEFKTIEKLLIKEIKTAQKISGKKKRITEIDNHLDLLNQHKLVKNLPHF